MNKALALKLLMNPHPEQRDLNWSSAVNFKGMINNNIPFKNIIEIKDQKLYNGQHRLAGFIMSAKETYEFTIKNHDDDTIRLSGHFPEQSCSQSCDV